jgi:hypothetical protein
VEPIKIDELQHFVGASVEMAIQDEHGGDQAPAVKKEIKKIQLCPDGTHIRFYFDNIYFLAVPLASKMNLTEELFKASDLESGLTYTFKKV